MAFVGKFKLEITEQQVFLSWPELKDNLYDFTFILFDKDGQHYLGIGLFRYRQDSLLVFLEEIQGSQENAKPENNNIADGRFHKGQKYEIVFLLKLNSHLDGEMV